MDNELLGACILIILGMLAYTCYNIYELSAKSEITFRYSITFSVKKREVVDDM